MTYSLKPEILVTYDEKTLAKLLQVIRRREKLICQLLTAHMHSGSAGLLKEKEIRKTYGG